MCEHHAWLWPHKPWPIPRDWDITKAGFAPVFDVFDSAALEALLLLLLRSRPDAAPTLEAADLDERWNERLCAAALPQLMRDDSSALG